MRKPHPKCNTTSLYEVTIRLASVCLVVGLAILYCGCIAETLPLVAPPNANPTAAQYNAKGIAHYKEGYWALARARFTSAIKTDPNLAESHFNLALTLDKLDLNTEATTHFKKAAELAPDNSAITQSSTYRNYTTPLSPPYEPASMSERMEEY